MTAGHYRALVEDALAGRRVVLVASTVATSAGAVRQLRDLGVNDVFVVAESGAPAAGSWSLGLPRMASDSATERRLAEALAAPPPLLRAALDRFDPDGSALVLDSYFATAPAFAGRRRYGWRRPAWARVEDKAEVEEVWAAAGIRHAASLVVPSRTAGALAEAVRALDRGDGVVCSADATAGWNTSGERTYWLPDPSATEAAYAALAPVTERIRVMPYVRGIPMSVHALVFDDDVAVFPPIELVALHPAGGGAFVFAGSSTAFQPPRDLGAEIRAVATTLAAHLRSVRGYRGPFTLDGIGSDDGFVPTEINARFGSGLGIEHSLPELPLYLLSRCIQEGEPFAYDPPALEALVAEATRRRPTYHFSLKCSADATPARLPVVGDGIDGEVTVEPDPGGWSEWSLAPRQGDVPLPGVLGPAVQRLLRELNEPLGLGLPDLVTSAATSPARSPA